MAGRTKLYQQAKSPLIQGLSKHDRPSWQPWLGAAFFGFCVAVIPVAAAWYYLTSKPGQPLLTAYSITVALWLKLPALAGACVGAALAIWIANRMGWRRRWLGSSAVACLFALAGAALGWYLFFVSGWGG